MTDVTVPSRMILTRVEELAHRFAEGASDRDRDRRLPYAEIDELSQSAFFGLTVPAAFGGPDAGVPVLTEAFRRLAEADPNIGQIPQSHFVFLEVLRLSATEEQQRRYFGEALAGRRFANAQSERGTRTITEDRTTLTLATAVAKVAAARASTEASSMLFELAGTRSSLGALNLSRFWRDARTHTLHDPSRWKVQHVGRWVLDGVTPPRHGLI